MTTYEVAQLESLPTDFCGHQGVALMAVDQYVINTEGVPSRKIDKFTAVMPAQFESVSVPVENSALPVKFVVAEQTFVVPEHGNADAWTRMWDALKEKYPGKTKFMLSLSVVTQLQLKLHHLLSSAEARAFTHAPDWVESVFLVRVDTDASTKEVAAGNVVFNAKNIPVAYARLILLSVGPSKEVKAEQMEQEQ